MPPIDPTSAPTPIPAITGPGGPRPPAPPPAPAPERASVVVTRVENLRPAIGVTPHPRTQPNKEFQIAYGPDGHYHVQAATGFNKDGSVKGWRPATLAETREAAHAFAGVANADPTALGLSDSDMETIRNDINADIDRMDAPRARPTAAHEPAETSFPLRQSR